MGLDQGQLQIARAQGRQIGPRTGRGLHQTMDAMLGPGPVDHATDRSRLGEISAAHLAAADAKDMRLDRRKLRLSRPNGGASKDCGHQSCQQRALADRHGSILAI